nr:leucine rich repeat containing protein 68 [Hymenolepis microstoma]
MLSGANIDATDSPGVKHLTVPEFDLSNSQRQKIVRFVEDDKLATEFGFNVAEPWCIDRNTPNHVIIDKYAKSCLKLNRSPLSTIIEQLSEITAPLASTKIPVINLKGTQLCKEDIQGLEEIFKYCETYHLNFENTNLTDDTLSDLLDALDYYKPCSELCLARNKIGSNGIKIIGNFISKYTSLTWLDLRGIPLLVEDSKHLRQAIILQCNEARKALTDFLGKCSGEEPVNPDSARDAEEDPEAFQLIFNAFISKSFATPAELNTISGALQRLPPLCLRGLHLGETGIYGNALADIALAIRLAGHLRDLRLNGNRIGPRDIGILAPLLRYHPNLQVIDLSNNNLGDEGFRLLSDALGHPSYPSYFLRLSSADAADGESASRNETVCNLRRIYLSATGLCSAGAEHFSTCLPTLVNLTHLELSNNPHLGCQGMIALRSSLQAYSRKHLVYLGLANCGLGCQGAIALAEVLGDSPRALRRIDLTGNHIAEAGFMALSKSIPLCSRLVHLQGLEDNRPVATFEKKGASIWTRNRSANRAPILLEPSKLSLDLIQTIHFQLAVNLDRHLVSHGRNAANGGIISSHRRNSDTSQGLRFFRGYVRIPPSTNIVRREVDPRKLCGDTSESEFSSSDSGEEEEGCSTKEAKEPSSNSLNLLRTDCVDNTTTLAHLLGSKRISRRKTVHLSVRSMSRSNFSLLHTSSSAGEPGRVLLSEVSEVKMRRSNICNNTMEKSLSRLPFQQQLFTSKQTSLPSPLGFNSWGIQHPSLSIIPNCFRRF